MKIAELLVCKGFLDQCPPETQSALIDLLSEENRAHFQNLPPLIPLNREYLNWDLLDHIHFTWIAPYLRTLTEKEIRLFLACLSQEQTHGLEKALGIADHNPEITNFSKKALRNLLLKYLVQNEELLPLAFLPEHPMNALLQVNSKALTKAVVFLGLHDLSIEMRQIIDTKTLKKIFAALPQKEGQYLNTLLLHREPLTFQRLFLLKWDGTKEHLAKLLEERGLHRLAQSLFGANDSLIWYITRKIEMHLGTRIYKYREKPTHMRIDKIISDQLKKILIFITSKENA